MELSNLLAARMQMAFTLGWHIIIACMGVGLPILLFWVFKAQTPAASTRRH